MPRGGARVGAGRPRKSDGQRWLDGNAGKRAEERVLERPKAAQVAVRLLPAPADLFEAQVAVWNDLAPQACQAGTLVPQTAAAFALLCKQIVLERRMFDEINADGLTMTKVTLQMDEKGGGLQSVEKKAHSLLTQHRGMMQRVEAGFQRFKLSPMGKPMEQPEEKPADPFAEFDGGVQ